jgi:hypothetical protein
LNLPLIWCNIIPTLPNYPDVAEENIIPVPVPSSPASPAIAWRWIADLINAHIDLGRFFDSAQASDSGKLRFIMGKDLRMAFPEDEDVSDRELAKGIEG